MTVSVLILPHTPTQRPFFFLRTLHKYFIMFNFFFFLHPVYIKQLLAIFNSTKLQPSILPQKIRNIPVRRKVSGYLEF